MAMMFSENYGNNSNNGTSESSSKFNQSQFILKDSVKNEWYLYKVAAGSIVRPYTVFNESGYPAMVCTDDDTNIATLLSDAFAVLKIASFAGVDSTLSLNDHCRNIDQWMPVDASRFDTPYGYLITALNEMLPERGTDSTKSGKPTPNTLRKIQKSVSYAKQSILFRGAVLANKGKQSAAKSAVGGTLFKTVFYIPVKSAVASFVAELRKPRNVRESWSPMNSQGSDLFSLDGVSIKFSKVGPEQSADYACEFIYAPEYKANASQFFQLPANATDMDYHNAIRNSYGPNQSIADILNIMTVEEMAEVLKAHYPISWIYYAWKNTPYAKLISEEERTAALSDPEMAPWFGVATVVAPAAANAAPGGYNNTSSYTAYQQAQYSGNTVQPGPAAGSVEPQHSEPVAPAPTAPTAAPAGESSDPRQNYWKAKYANSAADGIKY